jgi:hypothetical protein
MNNKFVLAIGLALAMTGCSLISPDANSVLSSAQKAMGSVKTIQYSGIGNNAFFGQALSVGKEWPRRDMTAYARTINYDQKSASEEFQCDRIISASVLAARSFDHSLDSQKCKARQRAQIEG